MTHMCVSVRTLVLLAKRRAWERGGEGRVEALVQETFLLDDLPETVRGEGGRGRGSGRPRRYPQPAKKPDLRGGGEEKEGKGRGKLIEGDSRTEGRGIER